MSESRSWVRWCVTCGVYAGILSYLVLSLLAAVFVMNVVAPTWSFFNEYATFSLSVVLTFPLWSRPWVTKRLKPLTPRRIANAPILIVMGAFVYLLAHLLRIVLTA